MALRLLEDWLATLVAPEGAPATSFSTRATSRR
jgi:hypothetical protein